MRLTHCAERLTDHAEGTLTLRREDVLRMRESIADQSWSGRDARYAALVDDVACRVLKGDGVRPAVRG